MNIRELIEHLNKIQSEVGGDVIVLVNGEYGCEDLEPATKDNVEIERGVDHEAYGGIALTIGGY